VYTMGTRAYAEAVCAAIDPDRKLFGGRILTRDESGSESQLKPRLFLYLTIRRFNTEELAATFPL
jgi:hypothetical protein